ncbi:MULTISPECIES: helix-turn-helix domain-containing protein [Yersiniaceae]|uniref:Helix-turn-helix domain-containing protein n=1 Tax=Nissabacter archeti TaxID=1917880 RepID=A0ABS5JHK2_9GAMM|nr:MULTISPECIES: helix-turn-helix domain-containing protein [Yersiniaceae]MBS0969372.1 helix-turn-helix domain-containing protein [Nissabacter archeti]PLR44141.1 DNA-binding protein [Chimaeribacter arupi]
MTHAAKLNEYQLNLLKRINNIALALMPEFEDKAEAMNAVSLDDKTLIQRLYTTMLEQNTRVPDSELRKARRRRENLEKFYEQLQALGGTLKVNDVANILGISRQGVNARVKKNRLLAFKQNGDFIYPRFQFTEAGLLPGFEEVMSAYDPALHPMLMLNHLKTPIDVHDEGVYRTPIEILQNGANEKEMAVLVRNAHLFGQQMAG